MLVVYGIHNGYDSATRQGLVFLLFATFMALGALFSWGYLPDVQRRVVDGDGNGGLETRNLEELGEGYRRARMEGAVVGLGEKWEGLRRRVKEGRWRRRGGGWSGLRGKSGLCEV